MRRQRRKYNSLESTNLGEMSDCYHFTFTQRRVLPKHHSLKTFCYEGQLCWQWGFPRWKMNYVCMRTWEQNIGGGGGQRGRKQDRQVMREQQSRLKNMSRIGMRFKKIKEKGLRQFIWDEGARKGGTKREEAVKLKEKERRMCRKQEERGETETHCKHSSRPAPP